MYYRVVADCQFDGVAYKAGAVIDLGDRESATRLLREVGDAVVLTNDPQPVVAAPIVEALVIEPEPEMELDELEPDEPEPVVKPRKTTRSKK